VTIEEMIEKAKTSNSLFIKRIKLESLPPAIFDLTNLKTLVINGVKIKSIPSKISKREYFFL
jgi:Leucine-rich repeat (LRR) protein